MWKERHVHAAKVVTEVPVVKVVTIVPVVTASTDHAAKVATEVLAVTETVVRVVSHPATTITTKTSSKDSASETIKESSRDSLIIAGAFLIMCHEIMTHFIVINGREFVFYVMSEQFF